MVFSFMTHSERFEFSINLKTNKYEYMSNYVSIVVARQLYSLYDTSNNLFIRLTKQYSVHLNIYQSFDGFPLKLSNLKIRSNDIVNKMFVSS